MPDIPATPPTSAIADTAAGAVDTATATAGAATAPPPEPPSPPPEAAPAPTPAPAPKPAEVVADVASAPAPKPAEVVADVASAPTPKVAEPVVEAASAPAPTPKASQVADTVDQAIATPTVKPVTDQVTTGSGALADTTTHTTNALVSGSVGTVTQATDPVVNATVGKVTQVTDPVVNGTVGSVTQVTDPVVNGTTGAVGQAVEPVVNATTTTVTQATDPIVSGTGGAGAAVKQTVDTVTATAGQAAAPARPLVDTVTSTAGQAAAPAQPLVDTVSSASSGATRVVEPVVSGPVAAGATDVADAIPGPAGQVAHQAMASAAGGGSSAADIVPQAGHGARGVLAETLAAGPVGVAAPPVGDPGALAAPIGPDPTTSSLLAHATPAAAPTPSGAAHSAAADTFAQIATDPRLLAVTGVTALAGSAYVAARAAGCVAGGDGGVILNNVRLIPCLAKSGMASSTAALAGFGSGVRDAAGSASRATRDEIHVLGEHVESAAGKARQELADHVVDPFRDGLAQATGDAPDRRGAIGSDLFFVGIGMVVGLLYAAILSLWLFLVRPRWSTRA